MQPLSSYFQFPSDPLIQIILVIAALVVVWAILRFVLRLALRAFSLGCVLILILGVVLIYLQVIR